MSKILAVLLFCCLFTPTLLFAVTPPALVPKTGQTISYGPGDDGNLKKGVVWPDPRFVDNNNGTVTDKLTELIWLKNANCFGKKNWSGALATANTLANGVCGLTDGSVTGNWRLPNITEMESLVDAEKFNPALSTGHLFTGVQSLTYWSSSTRADSINGAWVVGMDSGYVNYDEKADDDNYAWPVRGDSDL